MPETDSNIPPLPNPYHKGITIDQITHLIEIEGLNIAQTAQKLNCDKSTVSYHLKYNGIVPGYLKTFKDHRADVLADWQHKLLKSITVEDLKKASLSQKAMAFGVFFDKERLERGQSTENIAYADMLAGVKSLQNKRKELEAELGIETQDETIEAQVIEAESAGNTQADGFED